MKNGALHRFVGIGAAIASLAVLAMMLIGAADVIATLFGFPIPGALELMEMLMVLVVFLALPQVEARRQHIAIDLVLERLPSVVRQVLALVANALGLLFFAAMAWQAWKLFWSSWSVREYASGLVAFPIYPTKALFALGVTAIGVVALVNLWRSLAKPRPEA